VCDELPVHHEPCGKAFAVSREEEQVTVACQETVYGDGFMAIIKDAGDEPVEVRVPVPGGGNENDGIMHPPMLQWHRRSDDGFEFQGFCSGMQFDGTPDVQIIDQRNAGVAHVRCPSNEDGRTRYASPERKERVHVQERF
jgi:hypothetical protein